MDSGAQHANTRAVLFVLPYTGRFLLFVLVLFILEFLLSQQRFLEFIESSKKLFHFVSSEALRRCMIRAISGIPALMGAEFLREYQVFKIWIFKMSGIFQKVMANYHPRVKDERRFPPCGIKNTSRWPCFFHFVIKCFLNAKHAAISFFYF